MEKADALPRGDRGRARRRAAGREVRARPDDRTTSTRSARSSRTTRRRCTSSRRRSGRAPARPCRASWPRRSCARRRATSSSRCWPPPPRRPARSPTTSRDGIGVTDVHPAEKPRQPGASAPAYALQNLLVAERRRIAATQMRLLKAQIALRRRRRRARRARRRRLPQAAARREHGPQRARGDDAQRAGGIFKTIMDRYKEAAKGDAPRPDRDRQGLARRPRPHHGPAQQQARRAAARRTTAAGSTSTPCTSPATCMWEPAELAVCEALIDDRGSPRALRPQRQGRRVLRRVPGEAPRRASAHPRPERRLTDACRTRRPSPPARSRSWSCRAARRRGPGGRTAARTVAETLVDTSLRGVDSHGVARIPDYAMRLRAGVLNARPRPAVLRRDGAVALVDGDQGPGPGRGHPRHRPVDRARARARRRRRRGAAQRALRRGRVLQPAAPPRRG